MVRTRDRHRNPVSVPQLCLCTFVYVCCIVRRMSEISTETGKRLCDEIRKRGKDRGLLIAFEGPDGSGKTTQRKLFKDWLVGEGYSVTTTKWNSSKLIKPIIKARKNMR